jgi:predicted SprT family Zn-dependent metalloprotease
MSQSDRVERIENIIEGSTSMSFQERMEANRNSPEYQRVAEYIKGLPDEEKAEFSERTTGKAQMRYSVCQCGGKSPEGCRSVLI